MPPTSHLAPPGRRGASPLSPLRSISLLIALTLAACLLTVLPGAAPAQAADAPLRSTPLVT